MERNTGTVVVTFGENAKIGVTAQSLSEMPDGMNPIGKISAVAAGTLARDLPNSKVVIPGCDPFKNGVEESIQMKDKAEEVFPVLTGRVQALTGLLDTSYQAEAVGKLLSDHKGRVDVVVALEHKRRAVGQIKANRVKIAKAHKAHEVYILDPLISKEERKRRIQEVRDIYFTPQMYFDIMREFLLNVVGKVDNRGLIVRKISQKFRGN